MGKLEKFFYKNVPVWVVGLIVIFLLIFSGLTGKWVWNIFRTLNRVDKSNDLVCVEQRFSGESGFSYAYSSGERKDAPYLLLNRYDGDRKQSVSELVDLNTQEIIHTWAMDVSPIWDKIDFESKFTDLKRDAPTLRFRNDHALLLKDGSLIFIPFYMCPLLKIDKNSVLLWFSNYAFHHSIELDHEGNLWVPSNIEPSTVAIGDDYKTSNRKRKLFEDNALTKLSPKGKILFLKSVTHLLDENGFSHLVYGRGTDYSDPIHLNDIQPVLLDGEFWKAGDIFVSLRNQSMVFLYRPSTNKILWSSLGPWLHQHDVDIINNHEIGVFDNNARTKGVQRGGRLFSSCEVDGHNQYIVYDFRTKGFSNPFKEGFKKLDIRTKTGGRGEPYPYGKLFVEETNYGRLVVFDQKGDVEWQYINRAKNGKVYLLNWSRLVPRSVGDEVRKLVNK